MTTKIIARAAQVRCYECGATGIVQICHHCGVAICAEHAQLPSELSRWFLRHEFAGLPLPDGLRVTQPAHCNHCGHHLGEPNRFVVVFGVGLALLGGLLALPAPSRAAALLALVGLAIVAWAVIQQWRRQIQGQPQLSMPLLPRINLLKIRETADVAVTLTMDGDYQITQKPINGALELLGRIQDSERARLEAYRNRFALSALQSAPYHAGFLVLRGRVGLRFINVGSAELPATNIVALTGDTSMLALLNGSSLRESELFSVACTYEVCESLKPLPLLINLIPSLFQEADQHALALDLQWIAPRQWNDKSLEIERILLLRVDVPVSWGDLEHVSSNAVIKDPENGYRPIEWSQLEIDPAHPNWQRSCRRFSLRFKNQIERDDIILARAEVQFQGSLAGLEGADLFSPLGTVHKRKLGKPVTVVNTEFTLSLTHVRYQDTRVVPDFKHAEDTQQVRELVSTYPDIVPNHRTMTMLTEALAERRLYLKRIIENPPRVGEHVNQRNRYWDIGGREYSSVYPIDFHIVLSGEESYRGRAKKPSHTTHAALTVQGAYANPQMEAQIVKLWDEIHNILNLELNTQSQHNSPVSAVSSTKHLAQEANIASETNGIEITQSMNGISFEKLYNLLDVWKRGERTYPIQYELTQLLHELGIYSGEDPLNEKEVGGERQ